jgi:cellulose biosynthesis protein BcsQ
MKTIAIANHKGAYAKATTALNVAVTLANTGSRVLAVDLRSARLRCKDYFETRKRCAYISLCSDLKKAQDKLRLSLCITST